MEMSAFKHIGVWGSWSDVLGDGIGDLFCGYLWPT